MAREQPMVAVEFSTRIKDGMIEVPEAHRERFRDTVRVILLADEETPENGDMIEHMLANPIKLPGFTPLGREDAHERA